jgi:phosphoketolase
MRATVEAHEKLRIRERASLYRARYPAFAEWAAGYGVIRHEDLTQVRAHEMADLLLQRGTVRKREEVFRLLAAADRVASAAMWLVAHMTYARNVYLDGRDLSPEDFKRVPEGHTGGALNMAIAYTGYLAANAIAGRTRAWLMGQGHAVAAVDAANLIVGNMTPGHAARYGLTDEGLTRFVRDFYSYAIQPDGLPGSPLGSHVNAHTAGGMIEGGYLGFAEILYVHMPLPGESLVVFLSDGAFEEQRGGDWAPRWWRAGDSGLVVPIMIANGRRIDQRTTIAMTGGVDWLRKHLALNGFFPIDIDGRDPAAYAWMIFEGEERLAAEGRSAAEGQVRYPVALPHGIAEVPKGYGFPEAGTIGAHNLPLGTNPVFDPDARGRFNQGARRLWVPLPELERAVRGLDNHDRTGRVRERDNPLANRSVPEPILPEPFWRDTGTGESESPMAAVDDYFCRFVRANPHLRPRVGNPDEIRSNRFDGTLDLLKHRVTAPEQGVEEAVDGAVITVLNEEAVACAALGNKGGINIVVSYEAFAEKMHGAIRQELIFARHQREAGRPPGWIAVPFVLTSHAWENGKNEMSHQDPSLAEALLVEMADVSRVLFPADWNSAAAALREAYGARGEIFTMVVPKKTLPDRFSPDQARELVATGGLRVRGTGGEGEKVILAAVGAYQLSEVIRASDRLRERGVGHAVVYILEPGRFREPRDEREEGRTLGPDVRERLFPSHSDARVFISHTRPEPLLGTLRTLDTGREKTRALGFINRGGTLDVAGMLFANRSTWAHAVAAAAEILGRDPAELLLPEELAAVRGQADPARLLAVA